MNLLCDRCGAEIAQGEPIGHWTNGIDTVFVHRFPYQCDQAGVRFVQQLETDWKEWLGTHAESD